LGEKVGKGLQSFHESNGLTFNLGVGLKAINGENNRATSVVLSNGKELKADLILLGTGI
jgi:NADPH-dependent 2,4-dienoyl-CoA reductase/sulfur reductase-like enzyme